jgi:undecaprenyl pyrophosphate phosphatase UppP
MFFFLLSLPLLFAAFVLAIVSLVRGRVTGGICLLIGLFPAFMMAFVSLTERDKLLGGQRIETRSTS